MKSVVYLTCAALVLCIVFPIDVHAQSIDKKAEVPYRTDSGLITAEYELATGKYMQALNTLRNVLARHPDNADAYTYMGVAYQQLGDIKQAATNYKRALLLDPKHLGALKYLGDLFIIANDLPRAIEQVDAIRSVCGNTDCSELTDLQNAINKAKIQQKQE